MVGNHRLRENLIKEFRMNGLRNTAELTISIRENRDNIKSTVEINADMYNNFHHHVLTKLGFVRQSFNNTIKKRETNMMKVHMGMLTGKRDSMYKNVDLVVYTREMMKS